MAKTRTRTPPAVVKKTKPGKARSSKQISVIARAAANAEKFNHQKGTDAIATIARQMNTIAESFYDIGLALQVLRRKAVYSALGGNSFEDVVAKRTGLTRSLAFELVKIPEHLSREAAVALQREKASALIRYVDATPELDTAEQLFRDDATIDGVAVSKQSAVAIEGAARKAQPASKRRKIPGESEAHSAAHDLESTIEHAVHHRVHAFAVHRKGGWWIKLEMPIAALTGLEIRGRAGKPSRKKSTA